MFKLKLKHTSKHISKRKYATLSGGAVMRNSYYPTRKTFKLKAAVLDWSGTTVDKYVVAPAEVFVKVFNKHKVPITMQQARKPMGLRKDLHIAEILKDPEVKQLWTKIKGKSPEQKDVDELFTDFVPMQLAVLPKYSEMMPLTLSTINYIKDVQGLKLGLTTGFTKTMVDVLKDYTQKKGLILDSYVAGDEVKNGARPTPHMIFKNLDNLGIHNINEVLKVDDTVGGVGEGLNAGVWTCAIARWSNYMDIDSLEHEATLSKEELEKKLEQSREILIKSGAHYVIDEIKDLPRVIEDINLRMHSGENCPQKL